MKIHQRNLPRVVIIGGGFGGLEAAKALGKVDVRVTLLDRNNHHLFQPLLYQVATAALSPADIAEPLRHILRKQENAEVILGEAERIDVHRKKVVLTDGELDYDFLIVAAGARHSYFGHEEWEKFAPGLKSLDDALEIRRRMLLAFEIAERTEDDEERRAAMTFVVVGAGPTGVEMAGAIAEIARVTLVKDFRHIDPAQARVVLLDFAPRVLQMLDPELSESARRQLFDIGVEVRPLTLVEKVCAEGVQIKGGEKIAARTIVWAAGNAASHPAAGRHSPVSPPWPCSRAATLRAISARCSRAVGRTNSSTSTKAPWPPSGGTAPWRTPGSCAFPGFWRGSPGSSSTSFSSSASATNCSSSSTGRSPTSPTAAVPASSPDGSGEPKAASRKVRRKSEKDDRCRSSLPKRAWEIGDAQPSCASAALMALKSGRSFGVAVCSL